MKSKYSVFSDKKILLLCVISLTLLFVFNLFNRSDNQFGYLAESFLQGKTYFLEKYLPLNDVAFFEGKAYWPLGPFPSVLMIPFEVLYHLMGKVFYTGTLQLFLVAAVIYLVYKIALLLKYSKKESVYISVAFCLVSPFIAVAFVPASWFFAQVVCVFFSLLIIYEYLGKRRYALMGIFSAFLLATRATSSIIILFLLLSLFFVAGEKFRSKLGKAFKLLAPYSLMILFLLGYNYVRFGNIFEQGYGLQTIHKDLEPLRALGLFSFVHIPGNLYYFLLSVPEPVLVKPGLLVLKPPYLKPDLWGMSILVTSPYYLLMFLLKYKDRISRIILLTVLITAIPIFSYYGIGYMQYGYRYALDFLPLLFFLLIKNYKLQFGKLPKHYDWFLVIWAYLNIYLFFIYQYEVGISMDKML